MKTPWRVLASIALVITAGFLLSGCTLPGQKEFSGIQVETTDGSVGQVYLDGLHYGQTPFEKRDIRPGTYTFRLEPSDSSKTAYETQIHLYPNTITSVIWSFEGTESTGAGEILELEPLASKERAELSVITVPEGAKISLDETSYGLSPAVVESVSPGDYSLSIEAVAHVKKSLAVTLQPGYRLHVFSRLSKEASAVAGPEENTATASGNLVDDPLILEEDASPSPNSTASSEVRRSPTVNEDEPHVVITETGTGWLRVRNQASSVGEEVGRVDVSGKYPYFSTLNGWYEIEYEPGKKGWISGQYANRVVPTPTP